MSVFAKIVYGFAFKEYIAKVQTDTQSSVSIEQIFYNPAFVDYLSESHKAVSYLVCIIVLNFINFLLVGAYFVSFWKYLGATPGKLVMGMRIVDATTLEKPTTYQSIKRYCGYLTALFGIWSIFFTAHRQALHDKISSTMVIKS